jgi:hypothetical protein
VLGIAEGRARKPLCPRHRAIAEDAGGGCLESDVEKLDDRLPEPTSATARRSRRSATRASPRAIVDSE